MIVRNLGFDSLVHGLKNYTLYPVLVRGPHLALGSKRDLQGQHHVSILAGTIGYRLRGQAYVLLQWAWSRIFQDRLRFATLTEYARVWD